MFSDAELLEDSHGNNAIETRLNLQPLDGVLPLAGSVQMPQELE